MVIPHGFFGRVPSTRYTLLLHFFITSPYVNIYLYFAMASLSLANYHPPSQEQIPRVGKDDICYKWTSPGAAVFSTWWYDTTWYKDNTQVPNPKLPIWGSSKDAANWQYFVEGAVRSTGEPKIICIRCDKVMTHTFKHGTSAMSDHILTKKCISTSKRRGLSQPSVEEGFRAAVRLPGNYQELHTANTL